MPLFTPVLQDFQNRYGSSILNQHPESHQIGLDDDDDRHGELTDSDDARAPPDFLEHDTQYQDEEEDDEEEDNEHDDRRNLLFSGVGASGSSNSGNRTFFSSPRQGASGPFALDPFGPEGTGNVRGGGAGGGGSSRQRPHLDVGTDHEAPASLMIEMNHQEQDEDDSTGYWNFGDRARRRLQYKRPGMNAAELAMWKWVNVENLDNFLAKVRRSRWTASRWRFSTIGSFQKLILCLHPCCAATLGLQLLYREGHADHPAGKMSESLVSRQSQLGPRVL